MALTRKNDNLTPEENLLRLIERPSVPVQGFGETSRTGLDALSSGDVTLSLGGKKQKTGAKFFIGLISLLSPLKWGLSLKAVNRTCMVLITLLLGYAIWNVVQAEVTDIPKPDIKTWTPPEESGTDKLPEYYQMIEERDIFRDMYQPPVEPSKNIPPSGAATLIPLVISQPEIKTPLSEIIKNLKLVGVNWNPKPALVLIEDKMRNNDIHCVEEGKTFNTQIDLSALPGGQGAGIKDVVIKVKEVSKDKVILQYENEESSLVISGN